MAQSDSPRTYVAIDLKSFYASVECAERQLNPLTTHLVVADAARTEKTICLAVSPSLKACGISGRARLFEVVQRVHEVNAARLAQAARQGKAALRGGKPAFSSASFDAEALSADPALELTYIVAPPRMNLYMAYSTRIYDIYLKYVAPEDIHVYSIDECFLDVTKYLSLYRMSARELAMTMIREVLYETGITATCGIGTNLYLCKVAMDIVAKHVPPDADGVRIAELDEMRYRQLLWAHTPLTDFWRIGSGYARKLESVGLRTMGDIARCSIGKKGEYYSEDLLYKLFGVNAEILIDHAWGWEPVTIDLIKAYQPENRSVSSGQVLHCPYDSAKCAVIVREMADLLALDLVEKGLLTDQLVLTIGYDAENLTGKHAYTGPVVTDFYGRKVPKHAHGTVRLGRFTSSARLIVDKALELYGQIIDKGLLIRRVTIAADHVIREEALPTGPAFEQLDFFTNYTAREAERQAEETRLLREKQLQQATLLIKKRFGKNAILKGTNLVEGSTAIQRNSQVGGHKA